jgi:hypothetical protein
MHWKVRTFLLILVVPSVLRAQQSSVSAWDAADFRIWGYIPYWTPLSQINNFDDTGMYSHVSDVFHFGGLRPDINGNISFTSSTHQTQLNTIRAQMQTSGFRLHLSMFEVIGGDTDGVWNSIIADPAKRANFVSQVKTALQGGAGTADDLAGFNFDWERPQTGTQWGNYTQLAREMRAAINPLGMEVSVCDYGSTDSDWDNTSLFDAKVYDQLLMMVYHINATSSASWANTKKTLTAQGAAKAFSDDQIGIGVGTWGDGVGAATTVSLSQIVAAVPNLPYNQTSFTGTIGGQTGTWNIESREQVRAKTQLAFDRGMPGMFSWTLHYDDTGKFGLHRVMHHYMAVKREVPDLNLDGKVNATDATTLANNMGMSLTNTGMTSAAQFDAFYLNGNWEKGDRDGNGFVNQQDADWLAGRYAALGVTLPDRLAFTGTFESFQSSRGLTGRWRAGRNLQNSLNETSNFKQEANNFLSWTGSGVSAASRSNSFVTIRNQNAAESGAGSNSQARSMRADLASQIDLGLNQTFYFTFLVRENTSPLSASQLASSSRTLSLEFLDSAGTDHFDFALRGLQQQFAILSEADVAGQDVSAGGFTSNATYLLVGKVAGNGAGANTLQASLFPSGASVGDVTAPAYPWMLTALGGAIYNPLITQLQFTSPSEANFTVSNVWIGTAGMIPEPAAAGIVLLAVFVLSAKRTSGTRL